MFYFKFYDQKSKLVNNERCVNFNENSKVDPNNEDLAYSALKGTTFKRKTMMVNKLEYIPREFVTNEI